MNAEPGTHRFSATNIHPAVARDAHKLATLCASFTDTEWQLVDTAFTVAYTAHDGVTRASGDPYIIHPVQVAINVAELDMGPVCVSAALLHDVLEDTDVTYDEIVAATNIDTARIVDGVTKLDKVAASARAQASGRDDWAHHVGATRSAATLQKLLVAATSDIRVLVVKLADRLHNVSTLQWLAHDKQMRVAQETLDVYAPLAHRLGMDTVRSRLEDAAFAVVQPELFVELSAAIDAAAGDRERTLATVKTRLRDAFGDDAHSMDIVARSKSVYSVYRKMVARQVPFDSIVDLVGARIICPDVDSVYRGLGVVHRAFPPVPGRVRDYIASPKFNAYQSLHTSVLVDGAPVEVQLRTWTMHVNAELGVAAHWRYRYDHDQAGDTTTNSPAVADGLPWLARLAVNGQAVVDPDAYLDTLRIDLAGGEVTALTRNAVAVSVPTGATYLDFAFAALGDAAVYVVAAKADGRLVALGEPVTPGVVVDLIEDRDGVPVASRLRQVTTPYAKQTLAAVFGLDSYVAPSRLAHALTNEAAECGLPARWWELVPPAVLCAAFNVNDGALAEAIVNGKVSGPNVALFIARLLDETPMQGLTIDGLGHVKVVLAPCCNPAPGMDVSASLITGVVVVHRSGCPHVPLVGVAVDALWPHVAPVTATVTVTGVDRPGLLADVAEVVEASGLNVHSHEGQTGDDRVAHLSFAMDLAGHAQLRALAGRILDVSGVYSVDTGDTREQQPPM